MRAAHHARRLAGLFQRRARRERRPQFRGKPRALSGCRKARVETSVNAWLPRCRGFAKLHATIRQRDFVITRAYSRTIAGSIAHSGHARGCSDNPDRVRAGRFLRRQEGAAAVEFALVALPFFALMFAIIETALVFFAGQSLEAAAAEAGRQIMTGQVQGNATIKNADDYKTYIICPYLQGSFFDCVNGVYVSVKTYSSFQNAANGADSGPPLTA